MKENFYNVEKAFGAKNLSDLELKVLNYIISNLEESQKIGVRGVAEKNFTSTATVMRVAKKLNYNGFLDMIYCLKDRVTVKKKTTVNSDKEFYSLATVRSKSELNLISSFINEKTIYLYAEGYGEHIIEYIYRKLLVRKKSVIILNGLEIPVVYRGEENPTLFIISRSGETKSCLTKIDQIRSVRGNVISFTGREGSSLYNASDIAFTISDNNKIDSENYYSTYFFGNCINTFEKIIDLFMV